MPTAATTRMPRATMERLRLGMHMPPLDQTRRNHGEDEVHDGEQPQTPPRKRHLPGAGAELVDADDAVNCEIGRERVAGGLDRLRDRLLRPSEAGQKELRQAGGEEDEHRRL